MVSKTSGCCRTFPRCVERSTLARPQPAGRPGSAQVRRRRGSALAAPALGQGPDVVQLLAEPVVVRQARQRSVDHGREGLERGVALLGGGIVVSHVSLSFPQYGDTRDRSF